MRRDLIITPTSEMNYDDWLRFRKRGIGASEVGAVLGLSEYTSSIEIFYDKIGEELNHKVENLAMLLGHETEPLNAKLWQYWEGSEESIVKNFRAKRIVRKAQQVRGYVQNPKYPWLFVSLDRKINKHIWQGEPRGEGALELKNMSGFEVNKWEYGIPAPYLVQVQTQCLVCDFDYGELCIMKDGRRIEVHQFERNIEICEAIIEQTHDFWKKIERGRILKTQLFEAERNYNKIKADEIRAEIQMLEPEPDGSDGLEKFLKEKYRKGTEGERAGQPSELEWGIKHLNAKNTIKEQQKIVQEAENHLKYSMREIEILNFGSNGKIYWQNDISGKRVFRNKLKF